METTMQELIIYLENHSLIDKQFLINKCKKLLEKEKKQIIDAYIEGYCANDFDVDSEGYYKNNYTK